MRLTVMTFNVSHFADYNYPEIEDRIDMDKYADYIRSHTADIIGLNEVYDGGDGDSLREKQTEVIAEKSEYKYFYFAQALALWGTQPYGNAMIAKYPFNGKTISIPDPKKEELNGEYAETRCVLQASFTINEKKLTVLSCHFGLNDAEQRNAIQVICNIVETCDTPIVLMGDFNLKPNSPMLAPILERFEDTASLIQGENYTFPSNAPERKLDYIFVKGVKAVSAEINKVVLSDHYGLKVVIEL